ncbi:hypothetical protein [Jiangella alkaliphila]|uniref:hypothetical protein n=1 Tax=Jiangella alkaliphila TaxID=419479 RepID=UPI00128BBB08|nr:hypothetical protein [Jiangella alkaliphila]
MLMLTYGSPGDVEPFVALTEALDEAGHEAVLGAPFDLASMDPPAGLRVVRSRTGRRARRRPPGA